MQEMINWPSAFGEYHDSGEGGLFAWMAVPEAMTDGDVPGPNVYGNNCHVDVSAYLSRPRIMLNTPDVCVSSERRKVFPPYDYRDGWLQQSMRLDRLIKEHLGDDRGLRRGLIQSLGADDISVPMLAAMFLGSTCHSLYSDSQGMHFEVTKDDLTPGGRTLYNAWQAVYGVDPVILTFLDT